MKQIMWTALLLVSANPNVSGTLTASKINGAVFADQQAGADPCAQITNAIAALPEGSPFMGTVDARGFNAAQLANTCAADPFTNLHSLAGSSYGVLLLPPFTGNHPILTNAQWVIPNGWIVRGSGGTTIKAGASFPINTPVVVLGDAAPFSHGSQLYDIGINCNDIAGSGGLYTNLANEQEGWDGLEIDRCVSYGVKIEQTSGHSPQNWFSRNTYIGMSASSTASSDGIVVVGNAGSIIAGANFGRWTAFTLSSTPLRSCINVSNTRGLAIEDGHCEAATNGVLVANAYGITVKNFTGNPTTTNLVTISNAGGNVINSVFSGLVLNGGSVLVNDTQNSVSIVDGSIGFYTLRSDGTPGVTTSTSASVPSGIATLKLGGVSNSTGIQVFNSSGTSCTTAAASGATCTTGSISLPVGYSDTNYRLACTGLGPTNVPIVETYTKSNTSFTITLAALTAAAASFTSFDCSAQHN